MESDIPAYHCTTQRDGMKEKRDYIPPIFPQTEKRENNGNEEEGGGGGAYFFPSPSSSVTREEGGPIDRPADRSTSIQGRLYSLSSSPFPSLPYRARRKTGHAHTRAQCFPPQNCPISVSLTKCRTLTERLAAADTC